MESKYGRRYGKNCQIGARFLVRLKGQCYNNMRLPSAMAAFVKAYMSGSCNLVGPSQDVWAIRIIIDNEGCTFADGWDIFVADHELAEGFLLCFKYIGDSAFEVIVFGISDCEYERGYFVRYGDSSCKHVRKVGKESVVCQGNKGAKTEAAAVDIVVDVNKLTTAELKKKLRHSGLHIRGNKDDLVRRLQRYMKGKHVLSDKVKKVGRPRKVVAVEDNATPGVDYELQ